MRCCEVTDTGPGIPADELPHIFDRFWRGLGSGPISGSGIGLAVAAELARAHGGRLTATSQPGHGTQMTLTLPAPDPSRRSQAAQGRGGPFSTRSPLPHHLAFTDAGSLTGFSGRRPARGWGWERNHN